MQPDQRTADLQKIITRGVYPNVPGFDGPQAAIVISATASTVTFLIPSFSANWAFGPAPYQAIKDAHPGVPPQGTPCIAVPVSGNPAEPSWMVHCFQGWPTFPAVVPAGPGPGSSTSGGGIGAGAWLSVQAVGAAPVLLTMVSPASAWTVLHARHGTITAAATVPSASASLTVQGVPLMPTVPAAVPAGRASLTVQALSPGGMSVNFAPTVPAWTTVQAVGKTPTAGVTAPAGRGLITVQSSNPGPFTASTIPAKSASITIQTAPVGVPRVVQSNSTDFSATTAAPHTFTVSLGSPSVAGHDVLLAVAQYAGIGSPVVSSVTATGFNNLATVGDVDTVPTLQILRLPAAASTSSASITASSNVGGGAFLGAVIAELDGVLTSGTPEVLYEGHSNTGVSTFTVSGATAPTVPGELMFMAVAFEATSGPESSSCATPADWNAGAAWSNNTVGQVIYTFWTCNPTTTAPAPVLTGFSSSVSTLAIIIVGFKPS